jgi:beta-lactam-binding protein with PASTA domain
MHGSNVFLVAFFTSALTAAGTVYAIDRYNLLQKPEPALETVVPDLRGFSEADAQTNARASHLALLVAAREPSAEGRPGTVLRQSIPAGQRVPREHPVSVVLAEGLPKLPSLTGLTADAARERLTALGYVLTVGESVTDPQAQAGTVTAQTPAADTPLEKGKSVTVTLSAGPGDAVVPKVAGLPLARAKKAVEAAGFEAEVRWVSLPETATYVVLNQKPVPGEKLEPKSKVELVVNR